MVEKMIKCNVCVKIERMQRLDSFIDVDEKLAESKGYHLLIAQPEERLK
jgi:hypothetical protein